MHENQWLACEDPTKMLNHLGVSQHWGYVEQSPHMWVASRKKSKLDRKLRLFACACCRRIWHLITDQAARKAVAIAQQFADGKGTAKHLREASHAAARCTLELEEIGDLEEYRANQAVLAVLNASGQPLSPLFAARNAAEASGNEATEREAQCHLIRDVFGNPFRAAVLQKLPSKGAVADIATAIYVADRFGDLPVLADALEEAGCTTDEVLNHCRAEVDHVRGCWVVDQILGKS